MLDESTYKHLADAVMSRIEDVMGAFDPDVVDCDRAGDVVTLTLGNTIKCIVNTQRPTRQIWLAARDRAWHFAYDDEGGRWMDDKGTGSELFATISSVVKQHAGVDVPFG
jgi:CyaY protein